MVGDPRNLNSCQARGYSESVWTNMLRRDRGRRRTKYVILVVSLVLCRLALVVDTAA